MMPRADWADVARVSVIPLAETVCSAATAEGGDLPSAQIHIARVRAAAAAFDAELADLARVMAVIPARKEAVLP